MVATPSSSATGPCPGCRRTLTGVRGTTIRCAGCGRAVAIPPAKAPAAAPAKAPAPSAAPAAAGAPVAAAPPSAPGPVETHGRAAGWTVAIAVVGLLVVAGAVAGALYVAKVGPFAEDLRAKGAGGANETVGGFADPNAPNACPLKPGQSFEDPSYYCSDGSLLCKKEAETTTTLSHGVLTGARAECRLTDPDDRLPVVPGPVPASLKDLASRIERADLAGNGSAYTVTTNVDVSVRCVVEPARGLVRVSGKVPAAYAAMLGSSEMLVVRDWAQALAHQVVGGNVTTSRDFHRMGCFDLDLRGAPEPAILEPTHIKGADAKGQPYEVRLDDTGGIAAVYLGIEGQRTSYFPAYGPVEPIEVPAAGVRAEPKQGSLSRGEGEPGTHVVATGINDWRPAADIELHFFATDGSLQEKVGLAAGSPKAAWTDRNGNGYLDGEDSITYTYGKETAKVRLYDTWSGRYGDHAWVEGRQA